MQQENASSENSLEPRGSLSFSFEPSELTAAGKKRLPGRPKGSCNKYPGKKRFPGRPRGTSAKFAPDIRRKRGPKGKLKPYPPTVGALSCGLGSSENVSSPAIPPVPGTSTTTEYTEAPKEKGKEEEPAFENKIVLCSSQDRFVLGQDLCAMCGSLGEGNEGKLIACSQCGQCYHPFCVNIKVTKVIVNKGWRCLECTVCEGCGQPHDEARLLLCDECDISYHTYCLETPLDEVPQGTWKCRWCVVCVKCGATTPGYKSLWQKNYTECGPCSSQTTCPLCNKDYCESELIIQCLQCNRWLHAKCDGMTNEDDCESAADFGYHCLICRPKDEPPPHLQVRKMQALAMQQQNSKSSIRREDLSENSFSVVSNKESLSRRSSIDSSSNKTPIVSNMTSSNANPLALGLPRDMATLSSSVPVPTTVLSTSASLPSVSPSSLVATVSKLNSKFQPQYRMDGVVLSESGMNQIKSLLPEQPKRQRAKRTTKQGHASGGSISPSRMDDLDEGLKDDETASVDDAKMLDDNKPETDQNEKKKRQRRVHKLGIGGFLVKQRGRLSKDEDLDITEALPDAEAIGTLPADKPKRRRRTKKKSQLQDTFPTYLQEAFFGKVLLDSSKDANVGSSASNQKTTFDLSEDETTQPLQTENSKIIKLNASEIVTLKASQKASDVKAAFLDETSSGALDDDFHSSDALRDLLPLTQDLPQDDELVNMLMNEGDDLSKTGDGLDDLPVGEKSNDGVSKTDDPIDSVLLSPHFNLENIVADSGLPHMDCKEVEDVFKGVLSPEGGVDVNQNFGPLAQMSELNIQANVPNSPSVSSKPGQLSSAPFQMHFSLSRPPLPGPHDFGSSIPSSRPVNDQSSDYNMQKPTSFSQSLVSPSPSLSPGGDSTPQWPTEQETETTSQGQKNIQKWESDEALGSMATISPVLYANLNYPNLKTDYPSWSDRVKQISKYWRQLGSDQRQPYLQKARENRAANRIHKAQSEQGKGSGKDGRPFKESEQERQWKQMQAIRQQQMQQQHQVLIEQKKKGKLLSNEMGGVDNEDSNPFSLPSTSDASSPSVNRVGGISYQKPSKMEPLMPSELSIQPGNEDPTKTRIRINLPLQTNLSHSPRVSNSGSPVTPQMSSLIQVSRVRPPIDPNLIPGHVSVPQAGQDPYCNPPSTPRPSSALQPNITPPKPPFSPSSPSGTSQPMTPVPSDIYQTSPKTPRSHGCEPFSGHLQSTAPSPVTYTQQPRTPKPSASPFSPNPAKPCLSSAPETFSPGHMRIPQQQTQLQQPASQQQGPPASPLDTYSPLGSANPGVPDAYSPAPRMTQSLSTESFMQAPSTPRSDTSSPYSRPPPTPHQEYVQQQASNAGSEGYSHSSVPRQQQVLTQYDSNDPYARQVPTPRSIPNDPYARPPGTPHPSSSQHDPYAYQPATPRPHFTHRMPANQTQHPLQSQSGQIASPSDPYAQQPMTPMPSRDYIKGNHGIEIENQGRQQLRDLLQKQDLKRQPEMSQQWSEPQDTSRQMFDNQGFQRTPVPINPLRAVGPMHPPDGFRPPFPPGVRPRMISPNEQHIFRHPGDGRPMVALPRAADPRLRAAMQQQQQQQWLRLQGSLQQLQQQQLQRTPLQQKMVSPTDSSYVSPGQIQGTRSNLSHSMPGSALQGHPAVQPYIPATSNVCAPPQQMRQVVAPISASSSPLTTVVGRSESGPKEIDGSNVKLNKGEKAKEDVNPSTSELIKQVQEQSHPDLPELDAVTEDLDDDELLGLGNDFNILEYADPELDKALGITGGSKNNIFDEHFDDLVEKDEVPEKSGGKSKTHPGASDEQKSKDKQQENASQLSIPKTESKSPGEQKIEDAVIDRRSMDAPSTSQTLISNPKDAPPAPPPPPYPGIVDDSKFPTPQLPPPYEGPPLPDLKLQSLSPRPFLMKCETQHASSTPQVDGFSTQTDALLSDLEFERLKADILSDDSLGVAGGPMLQNSPMRSSPGSMSGPPFSAQPNQPPPWLEAAESYPPQNLQPLRMPLQRQSPLGPHMQSRVAPLTIPSMRMPLGGQPISPSNMISPGFHPQRRQTFQLLSLPAPTTPPVEILSDHDRQQQKQYEHWLSQQQNLLSEQQKQLEAEVGKLRKLKKALNAKQRQLKKGGGQLSDQESSELQRLTSEQAVLQKNLEKVRKDARQHLQIVQEYQLKQQKRQGMVGGPQTSVQIPPSPGSALPVMSSPRPPQSPMLMGPSGPGTPLPMNNPSTPIPMPNTPQSPSIMSPSPLAPSPSPLMQNSPAASLQHSPASNVTPASPMIHSPIYQQQSSPMNVHGAISQQENNMRIQNQVQMSEEGGTYGDMYQQKERMILHGQLRSPVQSNTPPGFGKPQSTYENQIQHQNQFQPVHQMRPPMGGQQHQNLMYHNRPMEASRIPRPYSDASHGYQQQTSTNQQVPNQQLMARRMPPPPPYSAYYHQTQQAHPQQQPQVQMRQFGPQGVGAPPGFIARGINSQSIRMVSNVQGSKILSGGEVTTFQIGQKIVTAGSQQQNLQLQQLIRQQQHQQQLHLQQQQQHHHLQHMSSMHPQQNQQQQHQIQHHHHQQQLQQHHHTHQQLNQTMLVHPPPHSQVSLEIEHQSYQPVVQEHENETGRIASESIGDHTTGMLQSGDGLHSQRSTELQNTENIQNDVGEAKTSFTLNFEESGAGKENEAINDSVLEGTSNVNTETQTQQNGPSDTHVEIKKEVKEFSGCNQTKSCPDKQFDRGFVLKVENQGEDQMATEENLLECSQQLQHSEKTYSNKDIKTNYATEAGQSEEKEDCSLNEFGNTKQNVLLKQLLQNCPSADSQSATESSGEEKPAKEPSPEHTEQQQTDITPTVADNPNIVDVKLPITPSMTPAVTIPVTVEMQNTCSSGGGVSPEKKMSYLDIRRAQLEREPTPPPDEAKPKRKRIVKRKDSKASETGAPTKKRARKASNSKPDEDHEMFMTSLMGQLRALPQMHIVEPTIRPNFNICPVYGSGDLNDSLNSPLRGVYGHAYLPGVQDCYSSEPFVPRSTKTVFPKTVEDSKAQIGTGTGLSRGFYNQEFSKNSFLGSQYCLGQFSSKSFRGYLRDADSPNSIVSSSSPECYLYEEPQNLFRSLSVVKDEDTIDSQHNMGRISPEIPVIMPIPTRPVYTLPLAHERPQELDRRNSSESEFEKDKENMLDKAKTNPRLKMGGIGGALPIPLRESGNVAVTLTLSSADDVKGILSALCKILDIAPPANYDIIERTSTPPSQKLGLYSNKDGKIDDPNVNIENILNGKMKFCRFCEIVIMSGAILKRTSELPASVRDDLDEDEVSFCSSSCYMQYALSHRATTSLEDKEAGSVVSHLGNSDSKCDLSVQSQPPMQIKAPLDLLPPMSPMMEEDDISERNSISQPLSPQSFSLGSDKGIKSRKHSWIDDENNMSQSVPSPFTAVKQWKSIRYKVWTNDTFRCNVKEEPDQEVVSYDVCIKPENLPEDQRRCALCHERGDGKSDGCARLLNMDVNKWVHLNCALWSSEVYETVNGSLINVDIACKRAMAICCVKCQKVGASLKCFKVRCTSYYHFPCAVKHKCMFFKDKTLFCPQHVPKVPNSEAELTSFVVYRRVYVNRDEHKQMANMIQQGDQNLMRIGNMIFLNIGQLLPHQLQAFHTANFIYPVGYKIIRFYWSMRALRKRCKYTCSIADKSGYPEFSVEVEEPGYENTTFKGVSARAVWQKIITPIVQMRQEAQTIKVFSDYITGEDLFGLTEPAVVRILESLPGVDTLMDYNFRYGRSQFLELPLAINPTGCARTEPKLRTHFKRPHTLHTSNATRSSLQSSISGMEIQSPYIKQFVHSKSSQYRKMKMEWRNNVFLARSRIQGLGLCAARDIEKHTMVIEYIGLLIRNEIAERNERLYEAQNRRGVYMFRLDENRVVDATISGGLARYVNHSCNPNCVAEVVQIDRENKILIIANRKILKGEELTYDYQFEVEDDSHKIQCMCGAPNCRKWMN